VNWPGQERWLTLCQTAGANKAAARWYERLARAYDEPQRHYHNQQHIAECLWEFDQARSLARQPITVELALWFHDAVYDPKAGDNEEQSAALAKSCLREGGVSEALVETVGLATKKRTQNLCNSLVSCFCFRSQGANDSRANCGGADGCKTPR